MRTLICFCAAPVLFLWTPAPSHAAPFDPQDSQVILTDTSGSPPDTKGQKLRTLGAPMSWKAPALKVGTSQIRNDDKKIQQESLTQFALKDGSYKPGCIEVFNTPDSCDKTKATCLSSSIISTLDSKGSKVNDWQISTDNDLTFSWEYRGPNRIQINTGINKVAADGPANAIDYLYFASGLSEGDVTINGVKQTFTSGGSMFGLTVHYCKVSGQNIDCKKNCVKY